MKLSLSLLLACLVGPTLSAATTVAGTLCSGTRATVTLRQLYAQGSAVSPILPVPRTYTAGAFSASLNDGADGTYYSVRVQCPALQPSTDTTYRWMIPQATTSVTPAQVSVATDGSVAISKGYYWDDVSHAWKSLTGPVVASAVGTGTVTSAGLTGDGVVFNAAVTNSPITTNGSLVPTLHTQSANRVLAGPTTGSAAAPTFRALVTADIPNSGGGSPPPASSQLGDFWVVRTSATILTIGPACSSTFPCKIAFGTAIFTLTTPATATISAGTDTAYIYVSDAQVLSVGVNSASFTCSGCTRVTGITSFPDTSFPLWTWTATGGAWDLTGGSDQRTIIQKGADPLATYVLTTANTQLKNAVTTLPTANMATVSLRRVCSMLIGADNGTALADADIGPQGQVCKIAFAATVVEIDVNADAGTPSVIVRKKHCATFAAGVCTSWTSTDLLSSALAAAASNFDACSNTGGTTGLDAGTTCSSTLQNTTLAIGDWIELKSGTAGGTAKRLSVDVIYTVN